MRFALAQPDLAADRDPFGFTSIADDRGGKASWTSEGSQGPLLVTEWERGRLTVTDLELSREHLLEGGRLFRVGPRSELLLAHDGCTVFAAGLLRAGDHTPPSPRLCRCDSPVTSSTPGWWTVPLEPAPDGLCGLQGMSVGVRLAGHRAGRPVVLDAYGAPEDVPDVRLDPSHPHVVPLPDGSLAMQPEIGPQLWTRSGGSWSSRDLPRGLLDAAARSTVTGELRVVVDGRSWREIVD